MAEEAQNLVALKVRPETKSRVEDEQDRVRRERGKKATQDEVINRAMDELEQSRAAIHAKDGLHGDPFLRGISPAQVTRLQTLREILTGTNPEDEVLENLKATVISSLDIWLRLTNKGGKETRKRVNG